MLEFQKTLPRLPVPALAQTIERYLFHLKGLVGADEWKKTKAIASDFVTGPVGPKLHADVVAHSQDPTVVNWLDRWWSDAYLKDRSSPGCYVSPTVVMANHPISKVNEDRSLRATLLIKYSIEFKELIDAEELPVDKVKGQPRCMADYFNLFSSCRVPLLGRDHMSKHSHSRHIVVLKKGHAFAVEVLDSHGKLLPLSRIYRALTLIEEEAKAPVPNGSIGALTAMGRNEWAKARGHIIASHSANDFAVLQCESALFVLTLDDGMPAEDTTDVLWHSMFGVMTSRKKGSTPEFCNRYYDKSMQVHVAENGLSSLTFEHSAMDSLPPLQWVKYVTQREGEEAAKAIELVRGESSETAPAPKKQLTLRFLDETIKQNLVDGIKAFQATMDALDLEAVKMTNIGSKKIKPLKCSPDALAQMSYQTTFKQIFGYIPSTYESAATKGFALGRTETLRTVTPASNAFVDAFLGGASVKEIGDLFVAAQNTHGATSKACAAGQGCDRHLYGMLCAAREQGMDPLPELFTDPNFAHFSKIELSTSHPFPVPGSRHVIFGPVSEKCVGIAYFLNEGEFLFGISAWQDGKAKLFADKLQENINKLYDILVEYRKENPALPRPKL